MGVYSKQNTLQVYVSTSIASIESIASLAYCLLSIAYCQLPIATVMHMFPSTVCVACECKRMWTVILTNNARSVVFILQPGTAGTDP